MMILLSDNRNLLTTVDDSHMVAVVGRREQDTSIHSSGLLVRSVWDAHRGCDPRGHCGRFVRNLRFIHFSVTEG